MPIGTCDTCPATVREDNLGQQTADTLLCLDCARRHRAAFELARAAGAGQRSFFDLFPGDTFFGRPLVIVEPAADMTGVMLGFAELDDRRAAPEPDDDDPPEPTPLDDDIRRLADDGNPHADPPGGEG